MTSVAFASMEVSGGPTVGFQGRGATGEAAAACGVRELFDRVRAERRREEEYRAESSESSSIGAPGESSLSLSSSSSSTAADDDDVLGDGEEVQSELKEEGVLGSMASLEECLPIKRGLSNCFAGKSKSFASLENAAALGSAGCLAKPENPFNKRRRILMASRTSWQRRDSYAALNASALRALDEDEDEGDETPEDSSRRRFLPSPPWRRGRPAPPSGRPDHSLLPTCNIMPNFV